jgi:hypothetical protein
MSKKKVAVENYQISNNFLTTSIGRRKAIEKLSAHEGLQTFYTPFGLADSMVSGNTEGTIRVFFNLEFLEVLLNRKKDMSKVQYVGDTERKCRFAKLLYKVETVLIDKENWDIILKGKKQIGEFFVGCKMNRAADVTFSNPPYKEIDITIVIALRKSCLIKKLIYVHPSTWLVETKTRLIKERGKSLYKKIRDLTRDHILNIEFFNPNPVFGIGLGTDCVITEIDFTKKRTSPINVKYLNKTYFSKVINIDDISIHADNWQHIKQLIKKLNEHIDVNGSFESNRISAVEALSSHKNELFVQISMIRAQKREDPNSNFFTLSTLNVLEPKIVLKGAAHPSTGITKEELIKNSVPRSVSNRIPNEIVFIFNSEQEKTFFLSAIKTDFLRLCLSIIKINSNLNSGELSFVPWLDFTQEWDDDKLFSFFGYAKGHPIREYAKSFLPDYHNLYPNGKSY